MPQITELGEFEAGVNEKIIRMADELCRMNDYKCCYVIVGLEDGQMFKTVDGRVGEWPIPLGVVLQAIAGQHTEDTEAKKMWS